MKWLLPLLAVVCLVVAGCQSREARLKGTWKAIPVKTQTSNNLRDVAQSSFLSLVTQNLTFEFTGDGKFKAAMPMGNGTGTYTWEKEDLVLKFDTFAPQQPLRFRFKDNKLVQVTNFESDPKIELEKKS